MDELHSLLDKLTGQVKAHAEAVSSFGDRLDAASHNIGVLRDETERFANLCRNADQLVEDIDQEFMRLTELDRIDLRFLAIATAFQTARWVLMDWFARFGEGSERDGRVAHDDKSIKDETNNAVGAIREKISEPVDPRRGDVLRHRTWGQIISEPVPFDVVDGASRFGLGMSGVNHREMTLGHDPILGWFFGTVNILTDTTTIKNGRTFGMSRIPKLHFAAETTFAKAFLSAYRSCMEDRKRLSAAISMEAIHLKSDFFTKAGLPIPVITTALPDLSSSLYKSHYDALCLIKDMGIVGLQAVASCIINMVISQLHGYFYDAKHYPSREVYEVKTRKIILYSSIMAETSNIISVAVRQALGDVAAWRHLDFGGLVVLLWRIITDVNFIYRIREEYLRNRLREVLTGDYQKKLWPMEAF